MTRKLSAAGGFTLVEVLIALSVLGVTMAGAAGLFASGLRLRTVAREHLAFERDARALLGALTDDLAHLVPAGPAPMVTADAVVLWRRPAAPTSGGRRSEQPLLVTYQWAVGAAGDSLLVRLAAPLPGDAADGNAVGRRFLGWALPAAAVVAGGHGPVREGPGTRFGPRAVLRGLAGSWVAYPRIRAAVFAVGVEGAAPDAGPGGGAQLAVKLSPRPWPEAPGVPDPRQRLALLPDGGGTVLASLWLPGTAQVPPPGAVADLDPEVEP
ncbi:MAG: type II secretion system protein [Candidatus Krumholzibacteriia bacterium]